MSKVFVIQQPQQVRDYSSASRYGAIEYLLQPNARPSLTPGPVLKKLVDTLQAKKFNPETDYLLWAGGDPLSMFLAGVALHQMGYSQIQFLVWERERDPETGLRKDVGFYTPCPMYFRRSTIQQKDHGAGYDN